MIVALDTQLAVGTSTGIGEYAQGLSRALQQCGVRVIELSEASLDPWRFDRRVVWDQVLLPQRARASGAQLLHCASGTMPLRSPLPAVVTVHDVAWLKVQQHTRPYARYYFGKFALQRYRGASAIIVDSEFSKSELLGVADLPAKNVRVIYPGVADDYCELDDSAGREPFVLVPGTVEPRKNLEVLVRALAHVPRARLVSVGPLTPYARQCADLAGELGVADRFEMRGYVPRAQLLELYARCALVAVPSRYEGFGYAAAQALCAGAPLAISDCPALLEVAGAFAPAFPAGDTQAWGGAVQTALDDPQGARERARRARPAAVERFSWESSARGAIAVYESVLGAT